VSGQQNPLEILSAEEFRIGLARWMLANARTAPRVSSPLGQDYVAAYRIPELDWALTQSYAGADGRLYIHFCAELRLLSCQTRDGKTPQTLTVWQIRAREVNEGAEETVVGYGIG
jgi:hypothetical protein